MRDYITDDLARIMMESADWSGTKVELKPLTEEKVAEDTEETEVISESVEEQAETHTCPLCESTLEEELSDDILMEHINTIIDTLGEELNEEVTEEDENGSDFTEE